MAALPLAIAGASLAYLNARSSLSVDYDLITPILAARKAVSRAVQEDKINAFYVLEEKALSPETANMAFIAVPPATPRDYKLASLQDLKCQEWTFREVYDATLRYAAWLKQEHGVCKDDIIALNCTNKPQFVFVWFAAWSLGAKLAFINTNLRGNTMTHCVRTGGASLLLMDADLQVALTDEIMAELEQGNAEKKPVQVVVLDRTTEDRIMQMNGLRADDKVRAGAVASDMALLIYTSGTTGLPKPAIVTWGKISGTGYAFGIWMKFRRGERYYSALPLYHFSAAGCGLCVALMTGSTFIISPRFSPRTFFASAAASHATTIQYIGEMCRYLVSTPPSPADKTHNIRRAFGNGLRPDIWQRFKDRFNIPEICEFYGSTEGSGATFVKSRNNFNAGTVGQAGWLVSALFRSASAIVVHDIETGEPGADPKTGFLKRVKVGEPGELIEKLDEKAITDKYRGYYGNAKASQSKILRNVFVQGDAYFRTGDLMRNDAEGRRYFVDRVGDTFRWKGENVSTTEVAEMVSRHPAVVEVNVYGVQLPSHDGRAGCAALLLREEPDDRTMASLADHVMAELPRYAIPLFLRVVRGFELTGTSKYTKQGLKNEGVEPGKTGQDKVYWLAPQAGAYKPFGQKDWESLVGGQARL